MFPQTSDQSVLVSTEVVWMVSIITFSNMSVIVIQSLFLDMLIFTSQLPMSSIETDSSLHESHGLHIAANLVVEVAHSNSALSKNHVNCLCNSTVSLVFELRVD